MICFWNSWDHQYCSRAWGGTGSTWQGSSHRTTFYITCPLAHMQLNLTLWWRDGFYNAAVKLHYLALFLSDTWNKCLVFPHRGNRGIFFLSVFLCLKIFLYIRKCPICLLFCSFSVFSSYSSWAKDGPLWLTSLLSLFMA